MSHVCPSLSTEIKKFDRLIAINYTTIKAKIFYEDSMAKQYNNYIDIIDFSRASTATHRDVDGIVRLANIDTPRIDYDEFGNRLGLLLEPSRTNLCESSSNFADSTWYTVASTVTSNAAQAPDDNFTADLLTDNVASSAHTLADGGITVTPANDYCFSVWLKANTLTQARIIIYDGGTYGAKLDLSSAAITSNNGGVLATGVIPYKNGWNRYYVSATLSNTSATAIVRTMEGDTDVYAGTEKDIVVWGAQLELGRRPSSIIYTEGAAVTRAIDYADIPVDAFRYSSNSGTIVLTARCSDYQQYNTRLVNIGTSSSEGLDLWVRNTNTVAVYRDDTNEILAQSAVVSRDDYHNLAFSYNSSSNVGGLAVNGITYTYSNVIPDVSTVSSINLNREGTNNGTAGVTHIKNLHYYPRALSLDYIGELTRV